MACHLDQESEWNGTITCADSVRIDGKFQGEIATEGSVIIGPKAVVDAKINAGSVSLAGVLTGSVVARQRVEVFKDGSLHCDVATPSIRIEDGASCRGFCETRPLAEEEKIPRVPDMALLSRQ